MMERRTVVKAMGKSLLTIVVGVLIVVLAVRGLRGAFVFAGILALAGGFVFFRGLAGFTSMRRKE
jgi:hypothetical protein